MITVRCRLDARVKVARGYFLRFWSLHIILEIIQMKGHSTVHVKVVGKHSFRMGVLLII